MAEDDEFGMTIIGSTITVYYKTALGSWTVIGTRTDSTYSGGGKIGVGITARGGVDSFGGGDR
jgi:hypothetical protein